MNNKFFIKILASIFIVGTISTAALVIEIIKLQKESSLTAIIASEK